MKEQVQKTSVGKVIQILSILIVVYSFSTFILVSCSTPESTESDNLELNVIDSVDKGSLEDDLNWIENESLDSLTGTVDQMQKGLDSLSNE